MVGFNDILKMRARKLAELGYVAWLLICMAAGKRQTTQVTPEKWRDLFTKTCEWTKSRFDAALNKLKANSEVDMLRICVNCYCFWRREVLNAWQDWETI